MPVHDFFRTFDEKNEKFISIDDLPDFRNEVEKVHTPLAVYNHAKPDHALAERLAEELINISGAFVTVFIKEPYIDQKDLDDVWDEDADPIYRQGFNIKAWFKADPLMTEYTRYGIDQPLRTTVVFARAALTKRIKLKRLITLGDVIEVPYNDPRLRGPARFRVLNAYNTGNRQYRWIYFTTICELLTGDEALQVTDQLNSKIR